jgi:hypothetical protein
MDNSTPRTIVSADRSRERAVLLVLVLLKLGVHLALAAQYGRQNVGSRGGLEAGLLLCGLPKGGCLKLLSAPPGRNHADHDR